MENKCEEPPTPMETQEDLQKKLYFMNEQLQLMVQDLPTYVLFSISCASGSEVKFIADYFFVENISKDSPMSYFADCPNVYWITQFSGS